MQLHEFNQLMNEQGGFTFPAEYYEDIIEPVYLEVNEGKAEFVKFCIEKDLNGLQLLLNNLPTVKKLAATGMTIYQIHSVLLLLEEKEQLIRGLTHKVVEQQETLNKVTRLSTKQQIEIMNLRYCEISRELETLWDRYLHKGEIDYQTYQENARVLVKQLGEVEQQLSQLEHSSY